MQDSDDCNFSSFFVAGISYKKSDATLRGRFSINKVQYKSLLEFEMDSHFNSFFILSTCNRTEIYGLAKDAETLAEILCKETEGSLEEFNSIAYKFQGVKAIEHLFSVASGMDSQILGDYEITGQLKACIRESKAAGRLNSFTERMVNEVYAACKAIRSKTKFSSGTVSVSFAAIQFIKQKYSSLQDKKILLIGTGKMGTNTCRNIIDYLPGAKLTIVNRSDQKATALAEELQISSLAFDHISEGLKDADIVIVSTQSPDYIICKEDLSPKKYPLLFIDMSVPCNINKNITELPGVSLTGVDELSKINDTTLAERGGELPMVQIIIDKHIAEFVSWHKRRVNVPKLLYMKNHLRQITQQNSSADSDDHSHAMSIQKTLNSMAVKLQQEPLAGCNYLEALSKYLQIHSN